MKAQFARWTTWWAAQPRRQQWLVLGALAVVGAGAVDTLVLAPSEKTHKRLRAQTAELAGLSARRQAEAQLHDAEQMRLRTEEAALRKRMEAAQGAIDRARAGVSGPEALRQRIRDLSPQGELRVVALSTLPAEAVAAQAAAGVAPAATGPTGLWRFPVTATVEGPYASLRTHLEKLENSPQGLQWQALSLDNATWPNVRMELKLSVLSDRAQWRGE
jgi:hypothetical protein